MILKLFNKLNKIKNYELLTSMFSYNIIYVRLIIILSYFNN